MAAQNNFRPFFETLEERSLPSHLAHIPLSPPTPDVPAHIAQHHADALRICADHAQLHIAIQGGTHETQEQSDIPSVTEHVTGTIVILELRDMPQGTSIQIRTVSGETGVDVPTGSSTVTICVPREVDISINLARTGDVAATRELDRLHWNHGVLEGKDGVVTPLPEWKAQKKPSGGGGSQSRPRTPPAAGPIVHPPKTVSPAPSSSTAATPKHAPVLPRSSIVSTQETDEEEPPEEMPHPEQMPMPQEADPIAFLENTQQTTGNPLHPPQEEPHVPTHVRDVVFIEEGRRDEERLAAPLIGAAETPTNAPALLLQQERTLRALMGLGLIGTGTATLAWAITREHSRRKLHKSTTTCSCKRQEKCYNNSMTNTPEDQEPLSKEAVDKFFSQQQEEEEQHPKQLVENFAAQQRVTLENTAQPSASQKEKERRASPHRARPEVEELEQR